MKQDVKKLWITALKSGEYSQTKCHLKDDTGYCCLGVLTDLYQQVTGDGKWILLDKDENGNNYYAFTDSDGNTEINSLPQSVIEWAGLRDNLTPFAPRVKSPDDTESDRLDMLNDNDDDVSFDNIAEKIEQSL